MEAFGFRDYHKRKMEEFSKFIEKEGFTVLKTRLLKADPVSECFLAARKN